MARISIVIDTESAWDARKALQELLGIGPSREELGDVIHKIMPEEQAWEFQPTNETDLDDVVTNIEPTETPVMQTDEPKRRGRKPKAPPAEPVATKAEDVIEHVNDPVAAETKALGKVISEDEAKAATSRTIDETKEKLLALSQKTTPTTARDFMIEVTGGCQRNGDVPDWMRGAFYDRLVAKLAE